MDNEIHELLKKAKQGDANALFDLGTRYEEGNGLQQDSEQAFSCYFRAADKGHVEAQYRVAEMYRLGRGTQQNLDQAASFFHKAARQHHQNSLEALQKMVDQGDPNAQYYLGKMHYDGVCVPLDLIYAAELFYQSAKQGNIFALAEGLYPLAMAGINDALNWILHMANQDNKDAQFYLGEMYEYGRGVSKDIDFAKKWYSKAAEQNHEGARNALLRIKQLGL